MRWLVTAAVLLGCGVVWSAETDEVRCPSPRADGHPTAAECERAQSAMLEIETDDAYYGSTDGEFGQQEPSVGVTDSAVSNITALGKDALPFLTRLAESNFSVARYAAVGGLAHLRLWQGRPLLVMLSNDSASAPMQLRSLFRVGIPVGQRAASALEGSNLTIGPSMSARSIACPRMWSSWLRSLFS